MKKYILLIILLLATYLSNAQDELRKITHIINATYDSKSELGYGFIDRLDQTPITFTQIEPRLLQFFDLNDDSLVGSSFQITYGTEKIYPEGKDAANSLPIKEDLVILDLKSIE